ncbi:MAG TPA: aminotransferase class I/II-fold pyridoxal phosphate-dependent enzyme [Actinomycetes bacterium]|nr:aminotransferase class I/II-fold pyridoxal phosphate-dependent enzyme [Actinomycetes bacterium]
MVAVEEVSLDELRRRTSAKWRTYPPDVLPLPVAEMDFPLAKPVAEALHAAIRRSDLGYARPSPELAEALAGFAARRWAWQVDPAQVALAPEVGVAVVEVLRLLVRRADRVVINPPVYDSFFPWLAEVGCQLVEVPLAQTGDGWALDLDAMQAAFQDGARVHLLCSPHNPTGTVHPREDLERLAALAAGYGVTVLSDEIFAPLVLPGRTHHPFLSVSPEAARQGMVFTSTSKAWNLAGLKCAVIVTADPATRRLVERLPEELPWRVGHLGVLASIAAFTEGEPWLEEVLGVLDHHRRYLAELLAARIPAIRYRLPDATYLAWLDCAALGLGDDPSAVFLARGRVALSPGPSFGRPGAGHARLNMGTSRQILAAAVDRMASAIDNEHRRNPGDSTK